MYKSALCLLAVTTAAGAAPPESPSVSAEVDQLRDVIKNLQQQVDQLKAENDDQWLTEQRADEIRGLVHDVLADADTRASLLQSGMMAGYDKGFFLSSADGNYLLRISGQLQIRYVYNWREDGADDSNRYGFEVRRAKVGFKGSVFDPSWTYDLLIGANQSTGTVTLDDNAWVQKDFGNGLKLKLGQMKGPFSREDVLSSTKLFAVERSLVNSFFTIGVVQGIAGIYEADKWRITGMYSDGQRSNNTSWSTEDTEYAFSARGEWLAIGEEFKSNDQYNGFRGTTPGLVLGAAINYQSGEYGTDTNDNETTNFGLTADATYLASGWSVAGAVFYRKLDPQTGESANQTGFLIRGGYFFSDSIELYGQYEWASADIDGVDDLSVLTIGVNKYFDKHNLKWQTDIGYSFNELSSVFASDGAGWLADSEDGEVVFRTQFQLLF